MCADLIEAEWRDSRGRLRTITALLEDISPIGVCVQLETAIPVGVIAVLDLRGVATRAMVRYCEWREIGYFAGLTFTPGSRWSVEQFQPQHLTDPRTFLQAESF